MKIALACQEAFAEEFLRSLQGQTLHEVLMIGDEHVLDVIGVIKEKCLLHPHAKIGNVAILLSKVVEVRQRPATIGKQA